jgi:hypothetical protein
MKIIMLFIQAGIILLLQIYSNIAASQTAGEAVRTDTVQYELAGTIISKAGKIVKVRQSDTTKAPAVHTIGLFSKYFEKQFMGSVITGWLETGKMKVISFAKGVLTLELLEERSEITVNGKKEDHFKPGFKVKFAWSEP